MNGHYYNEFDPDIAAWLRVLIDERLIPAGDVDERSIVDVKATELRGYVQWHFFAGIGGWPFALRLAGWPADRPVATCSCPCPPFSAAGKKKACPQCAGTNPMPHVGRTGFFVCCLCGHEWFADERHLWPEAWRIFRELRPVAIYGEQVASGDGRVWLAGVRASLQILGYDFGGADLCSSSISAPNIRQRLFWLADSQSNEHDRRFGNGDAAGRGRLANGCWMGSPIQQGLEGHAGNGDDGSQPGRHGETAPRPTAETGAASGVDDATSPRLPSEGQRSDVRSERRGQLLPGERCEESGVDDASSKRASDQHAGQTEPSGDGENNGVPRAPGCQSGMGQPDSAGPQPGSEAAATAGHGHPTEPAGFWSDAIWHLCRDGKQRRIPQPVFLRMVAGLPEGMDLRGAESGFPLAQKIPKRVMLLKGYGNAINPQIAAEFINATK